MHPLLPTRQHASSHTHTHLHVDPVEELAVSLLAPAQVVQELPLGQRLELAKLLAQVLLSDGPARGMTGEGLGWQQA